jgi:hypothetical protein
MKTDHFELHWADIARAAYMCGFVKDFSKTEMLRLSEQLRPEDNDRVGSIASRPKALRSGVHFRWGGGA